VAGSFDDLIQALSTLRAGSAMGPEAEFQDGGDALFEIHTGGLSKPPWLSRSHRSYHRKSGSCIQVRGESETTCTVPLAYRIPGVVLAGVLPVGGTPPEL